MFLSKARLLLLALLLLLISVTGTVVAAGSASSTMTRLTIDSGAHVALTSDRYILSGTLGQPDSSQAVHQGRFALIGGFWGNLHNRQVYLPSIQR